MIRTLRNYLAADPASRRFRVRNKLQHLAGLLRTRERGPLYLSFRPDSEWLFNKHPEFGELFGPWNAGNARNNAGDRARYYALILNVKQIIEDGIPGHFAELGVYLGNTSAILAHFAARTERKMYLFDTFRGFDKSDLTGIDADKAVLYDDATLAKVRALVGHESHCRYIVGTFPGSITPEANSANYAFVSLDADLYKPMRDGLAFFYDRLSPGGAIFVHDYSSGHWTGAKNAMDEFTRRSGVAPVLLPDKSGTAVIRKGFHASEWPR
jgi:hypothetical protein